MSFLDGLRRGVQGLLDGDRLALVQALANGDLQSASVLRGRIDEARRLRTTRDAQVIGAKDLGFTNDEIGALTPQDLSAIVREQAYRRLVDPSLGPPPLAPPGMPGGNGGVSPFYAGSPFSRMQPALMSARVRGGRS